MHRYPQNQSHVGSSGQTLTSNVSMTLGNWQICYQTNVLCGCTTFVPNHIRYQTGGGGGSGRQLPPQLTVGRRPLGGGGGGGALEGEFREGRIGGGGLGGAWGGGAPGGSFGGGSRWGDLGWWGAGGGAQAPLTSPFGGCYLWV